MHNELSKCPLEEANKGWVMRVPKILFSLVFFSLSIGEVCANGIDFREITNGEEWEAAFADAKADGKLIFADVYTDWCTYCHKLDKEVYTDPTVIDYFNKNFINIKFDAESQFGYPMAQRFRVDGYPTLLFLTAEQEVFQTIGGFVPAPTLLAYGEQTLSSYAVLPELLAKYDDLLITNDERMELIGLLEKVNPEKAHEVAKKHIDELISDDYKRIENLWLVSRFENQLSGDSYKYITSHKDSIISWHGLEEYQDYIKSVFNDNLMLSIRYGDEPLLNQLVSEVLPGFLEPYDLPEAALATKKIYYGQREEWDEFTFVVKSYLNNSVPNNGREQFLFDNALEIVDAYQAESMREFAAEMLAEAVGINEKNFEATSLLGYTNGLLGNFQSAKAQLTKARELANDDEERGMVDSLMEAVELMGGK